MKTNATMISCYTNAINQNEECMKTIGDRIEEFLREFGRARYENALPYTQVELVEMQFEKRDGTVNRWGRRRYRCRGRHCAISEKKVYGALRDQIIKLQDRAYRKSLIKKQNSPDTSSIHEQIKAHQRHIEQLKAGIKKADNDYYIHNRLDGERYDSIVASANKSIMAVQAEITMLQDRLYEAGQVAQRGERLQLIAETGLQHLDNSDIPASNAWLRLHFRVWVEGNEVFAVEIL